MSGFLSQYNKLCSQYEVQLANVAKYSIPSQLQSHLEKELKEQFDEGVAQLSALLPPDGHGHSGASHAGPPPATLLPIPIPAQSAHPESTSSTSSTGPSASLVSTASSSFGAEVLNPSPVTPELEPPSRQKRSRTVQEFEADYNPSHNLYTGAEQVLVRRYGWKKLNFFRKLGDVYVFVNPCKYRKGMIEKDMVDGDHFFSDADKALDYAKSHQALV